MPSQNKWSPNATTYKCNIQDCGDLLDIFDWLANIQVESLL
jgi:hypothetical protein